MLNYELGSCPGPDPKSGRTGILVGGRELGVKVVIYDFAFSGYIKSHLDYSHTQ